MNIGENIGEYRMWKSVLTITRQFMQEHPKMLQIFSICLFSGILRESTYVWFRLYEKFLESLSENVSVKLEKIYEEEEGTP